MTNLRAEPAIDSVSTTLLGKPRAAAVFALTVFVTTAIQVLSIPVIAFAEGNLDWGLPVTPPAVVAILVLGCAVQAAALAVADRWPRWSVVIATTTYLGLATGLGVPTWLSGMYLMIALALFLFATRTRVPVACAWGLGVIVVSMGTLFGWLIAIGTPSNVVLGFVLGETARFAAPVAGATALGIWWAAQVRRVTAAREEAALAKHEQQRRIAEAQQLERVRIAQELHDVAGQHLAGLITLTEAAMAIAQTQPDRVLALVEEVRTEGRFAAASLSGALSDMRAVGGVPREATPDMRRASELVDYWNRVGMTTSMSQPDGMDDLPAVVSSTAYRALQEALTNAAKHAPGASVQVHIDTRGDTLEVLIDNEAAESDAVPIPGLDLGWGLAGTRERVQLLRGTLDARPTECGWRVRLTIPLTHTV